MAINPSRAQFGNQHARKHPVGSRRAFKRWWHMMDRCYNPKNKQFRDWGGRGIAVCADWHVFENFYRDMGNPPDGLTLERADNLRGYSKDNCRWATRIEQMNNTRKNRIVVIDGVAKTKNQWARENSISIHTVKVRLRAGWDEIAAVTRPPKRGALGMNGVHVHKPGVYRARIHRDGKTRHLGLFNTPEAAQRAYIEAGGVS